MNLPILVAWLRARLHHDEQRGVVANGTIWLVAGLLVAACAVVFLIENLKTKK